MRLKRSANLLDKAIGKNIQQRRLQLLLTRKMLGDLLGVSFQQVQKYEIGQNRVAASTLFEIARILRVPLRYFFSKHADRKSITASIAYRRRVDLRGRSSRQFDCRPRAAR